MLLSTDNIKLESSVSNFGYQVVRAKPFGPTLVPVSLCGYTLVGLLTLLFNLGGGEVIDFRVSLPFKREGRALLKCLICIEYSTIPT